jgi:hypothetical protein
MFLFGLVELFQRILLEIAGIMKLLTFLGIFGPFSKISSMPDSYFFFYIPN